MNVSIYFIGLKPEKIKHISCGRSHTIVSTGNIKCIFIKILIYCNLYAFNYNRISKTTMITRVLF